MDTDVSSNWVFHFFGFPSLRTFVAQGMGGLPAESVRDYYLAEDALPYSDVTELFFARCDFGVRGLGSILRAIKSFEKLTYEFTYPMKFYELYGSKGVLQSIATHAGHSMQELTLAQEDVHLNVSRESICIAQLTCIPDGWLDWPKDYLSSRHGKAPGA